MSAAANKSDGAHVTELGREEEELARAYKTDPEYIEFVKTYMFGDDTLANMHSTVKYKTIKNVARLTFDHGTRAAVFDLLRTSIDKNEIGDDGESLLTYCLKKRHAYPFILLSLGGADLTLLADTPKGTALHRAVKSNNIAYVSYFCIALHLRYPAAEAKRIINLPRKTTPGRNENALFLAMNNQFNNYNIIELLLGNGADPNTILSPEYGSYLKYAVSQYDTEATKLLLAYGANPATAIEGASPQLEAILRRALAGELNAIVTAPNTEPPIYMFSQRGATCASDTISTVFLEADPIREDFAAALEDSRYITSSSAESNKSFELIKYITPRYKKMKTLEKLPPTKRKRRASLNTGEGFKILECFGGDATGLSPERVEGVLRDYLIDNKFGILKKDYSIRMKTVSLKKSPDTLPPFSNVFSLVLSMGSRVSPGHMIGFLKRGSDWYFVENNMGILHKMTDITFMHALYNSLHDGEGFRTIMYVYPRTPKTSSKYMMGYLCAEDTHYPKEYGNFGKSNTENNFPIHDAYILYQDPMIKRVPTTVSGSAGVGASAAGVGASAAGVGASAAAVTRRGGHRKKGVTRRKGRLS
jgi:hypothetical protein